MRKMLFPFISEAEGRLPMYLTSIGSLKNQDHMVRLEGFTSYHLLYCISGKGVLFISGNEYQISQNTGFFFRPGIPHEYYAISKPWTTFWVTFDGYAAARLMETLNMGAYEVFNITDMSRLDEIHSKMHNAASTTNPHNGFMSSSLLYSFLLELGDLIDMGESSSKSQQYTRLLPVISYIEKNYMRDLTLEDLSRTIDITPQHICRLFKQTLNLRPFVYVTRYRLQKAKELLAGTDNLPVKQIAGLTGFKDTRYFCAVFKEYEGMTPMEFKKLHRSYSETTN